jgi:oxygen-independent coproporphyrinogen-3 oxidase
MEANPGTVDSVKFAEFHDIGINRLSLGIQSFDSQHLTRLGRIHNGAEARIAIEIARDSGFDNLNLDLMHGLPQQDQASALKDLEVAMSYEPQHVSWYQLTVEQNTLFYRRPPVLPNENQLWDIQQAGITYLESYLKQYEVSAFSQAGRQCQHNLNYWQFGDYLGIGAGAHGKLTLAGFKTIIRTAKTRIPDHYMQRYATSTRSLLKDATKVVEVEDLPLEFMMNCLRLKSGVPIDTFSERTGLPDSLISAFLERNQQKGLLQPGPLIQATESGYQYLNTLLEDIL